MNHGVIQISKVRFIVKIFRNGVVVGKTVIAVIDDYLVWHGGMNLLGKEDVWDNLIRVIIRCQPKAGMRCCLKNN